MTVDSGKKQWNHLRIAIAPYCSLFHKIMVNCFVRKEINDQILQYSSCLCSSFNVPSLHKASSPLHLLPAFSFNPPPKKSQQFA